MREEIAGTIDLREYLALLWRWAWLIALALLVSGGGAYLLSKRSVPVYEASTMLMIDEGAKAGGPDYNAVLLSERLAKSYAHMLKGRPILRTVAEQLQLGLDERGLTELAEGVSVEPVRDTQLMRLRVQHSSPELAAAIADAIPQAFSAQRQAKLAAQYTSSKDSLLREMTALEASTAKAQAELDAQRGQPVPDSGQVARLETLVSQYRSTYSGLLQSYEEMRRAQVGAGDWLVIVDPAQVPERPARPRTAANTVLAATIGALLAAGAGLAIEYLDDTVKQADDLERAVHLPALATVGRFPKGLSGATGALVATDARSALAEAYRVLRTNLHYALAPEGQGQGVVIMVTSARPREGKTATVANLGVCLAQSRKSVLLVDADLRRPALHTYLGLGNRGGLTSLLLRRTKDPEKAIQGSGIARLRVLPAGRVPADPAEVLSFPANEELWRKLRALADYVIIDSPPLLSVADPLILARHVDGVVVVAEAGKTRRDMLRRALAALEGARAPILGVVLNKVGARTRGYYRDERYYGQSRREVASAPAAPAARPSGPASLLAWLRRSARRRRPAAPPVEVRVAGDRRRSKPARAGQG